MASGDYLVFLDGDDSFLPWALDVYATIADQWNPRMILGRLLWFEGSKREVKPEDAPSEIKILVYETLMRKDRTYRASASAMVIERRAFEDVRGWSDTIFPMDDIDIMVKLGYSGRSIQIWSPATTCYRVHASNTVHRVAWCIGGAHKLIHKEHTGEYPGGRSGRFERFAFIGGPVLFWVRKAFRTGFYSEGLRLFVAGWPMIMAAIANRFVAILRGRSPFQTVAFPVPTARPPVV
jgi:hypothetical protein